MTTTTETTVRYTFTLLELLDLAVERLQADGVDLAAYGLQGYNAGDPADYASETNYSDDDWLPGLDLGIRGGVSAHTRKSRLGAFVAYVAPDGSVDFRDRDPNYAGDAPSGPLSMGAVTVQIRKRR